MSEQSNIRYVKKCYLFYNQTDKKANSLLANYPGDITLLAKPLFSRS